MLSNKRRPFSQDSIERFQTAFNLVDKCSKPALRTPHCNVTGACTTRMTTACGPGQRELRKPQLHGSSRHRLFSGPLPSSPDRRCPFGNGAPALHRMQNRAARLRSLLFKILLAIVSVGKGVQHEILAFRLE